MKKSNKKVSDPFSTPARRRRIIAVVAKNNLRQYCIAACKNVARKRLEWHAAIIIQCFLRKTFASIVCNHLRSSRRNAAAIRIQSVIRMRGANYFVMTLRKAAYVNKAKNLVCKVEFLFFQRKRRRQLLAKKMKKLKSKEFAAVEFQRLFRGMMGRRRALKEKDHNMVEDERRCTAAITLQCQVRQFLAKSKMKLKRKQFFALAIIKSQLLRWKFCRRTRRLRLSRLIQRYVRGKLTRKKYRFLIWNRRIEEEMCDQFVEYVLLLVSNECIVASIPTPPSKATPQQTLNIHVDLNSKLLQKMIQLGPSFIFQWSVDHFILQYSSELGFAPGPVIQQVTDSVQAVLQINSCDVDLTTNDDGNLTTVSEAEHVIEVSKWAEGDGMSYHGLLREDSQLQLPLQWGDPCEGLAAEQGAAVHVLLNIDPHNSQNNELQLRISTFLPSNHDGVNIRQRNKSSLRDIYFPRAVDMEITMHFRGVSSNPSGDAVDDVINAVDDEDAFNDAVFRLNNALVFVSSASKDPPVLERDLAITAPLQKEEDSSDNSYSNMNTARPQTASAVVRILLKERAPSPVIDFDRFATIIQRACRIRLAFLHQSATTIQRYVRKIHRQNKRIKSWKVLMTKLYEQRRDSALRIQCLVRCRQSKQLLSMMRKNWELQQLKANFRYGRNYELNDLEGIWAAFGVPIVGNELKEDEIFNNIIGNENTSKAITSPKFVTTLLRSHRLDAQDPQQNQQQHKQPAYSNVPRYAGNEKVAEPSELELIVSSHMKSQQSVAAGFLSVIQLPDAPPHCLFPHQHRITCCSTDLYLASVKSISPPFLDPSSIVQLEVNKLRKERSKQNLESEEESEVSSADCEIGTSGQEDTICKSDKISSSDTMKPPFNNDEETLHKVHVVHPQITQHINFLLNNTIYAPVEAFFVQNLSHTIDDDSNSLNWILQFERNNDISTREIDCDENSLGDIFE